MKAWRQVASTTGVPCPSSQLGFSESGLFLSICLKKMTNTGSFFSVHLADSCFSDANCHWCCHQWIICQFTQSESWRTCAWKRLANVASSSVLNYHKQFTYAQIFNLPLMVNWLARVYTISAQNQRPEWSYRMIVRCLLSMISLGFWSGIHKFRHFLSQIITIADEPMNFNSDIG